MYSMRPWRTCDITPTMCISILPCATYIQCNNTRGHQQTPPHKPSLNTRSRLAGRPKILSSSLNITSTLVRRMGDERQQTTTSERSDHLLVFCFSSQHPCLYARITDGHLAHACLPRRCNHNNNHYSQLPSDEPLSSRLLTLAFLGS